uniref:Uncharacterized protein n=1 Tax=Leviviridae sp. TaxID=2027243 RepID=A0A514DCR5_9VIRU|nr:MAG: hypothetical protein H2Bulk36110_000003 [Leviviridae sp.]
MNPWKRFDRLLNDGPSIIEEPVVESASYGCYLWFMAAGVVGLSSLLLPLFMPGSIPQSTEPQPVVSDSSLLESCLAHRSPVPDCQRCGERASAR